MSRIVELISRFFEIGIFPKMEKYWTVPPIDGVSVLVIFGLQYLILLCVMNICLFYVISKYT